MARDCIFCAIAAGDQPAVVVDKTERTIAFVDSNPWARGHLLVIPRTHAENLYEISEEELVHTFGAARRLARRMRERLGCDGVALYNSCGSAAGQDVPHFHLHLIPHYPGDAPVDLPRAPQRPDPRELGEVAELLRG